MVALIYKCIENRSFFSRANKTFFYYDEKSTNWNGPKRIRFQIFHGSSNILSSRFFFEKKKKTNLLLLFNLDTKCNYFHKERIEKKNWPRNKDNSVEETRKWWHGRAHIHTRSWHTSVSSFAGSHFIIYIIWNAQLYDLSTFWNFYSFFRLSPLSVRCFIYCKYPLLRLWVRSKVDERIILNIYLIWIYFKIQIGRKIAF